MILLQEGNDTDACNHVVDMSAVNISTMLYFCLTSPAVEDSEFGVIGSKDAAAHLLQLVHI